MTTRWFVLVALVVLVGTASPRTQTQPAGQGQAQDVLSVLRAASANMGADNLKTIQYTASGMIAAPGQGFDAVPALIGVPESWPRFAVTNYTMTIDYTTMSSREQYTRTTPVYATPFPGLELGGAMHGNQSDPPYIRGGGFIDDIAPRQINQVVNGRVAWDVNGTIPVRQFQYLYGNDAAEFRQLEIILTPHGFVKAALAPGANPVLMPAGRGGVSQVMLTNVLGKYKVIGTIEQNLVHIVQTWIATPVIGDMKMTHEYTRWKDFGGFKFYTDDHSHYFDVQEEDNRQYRILDAKPNVAIAADAFSVPTAVQTASLPAIRVESTKLADNVWLIGGGSHNSVLVEFRDFVTVVEAPLNDDRSQAVIAEVRRLVPNKPIRYVVNTHYHWDHSGGLRAFVAAGAQIVTHDGNVDYYNRVMFNGAPRKLMPDTLSRREEVLGAPIPARYFRAADQPTMITDHVWGSADPPKVMEFYNAGTGSPPFSSHNEFFLVVYLPAEKMLINADLYTPPPAGVPPPQATQGIVALGHIIRTYGLNVALHVPIHGQPGPQDQFARILGGRIVPDSHGPLVLPSTTTSQ